MTDALNSPKWNGSEKTSGRACSLRRNLTDAERIVWYGVRAHRLTGVGFRRQAPIGPFVVDFVSHAAKLVDEHEKPDARRDRFLAGKGYRVLRFSNLDDISNRRGVLERIAEAVQAAAPSPPSPASGGGGPT